MPAYLQIRNLQKHYGRVVALGGVSLDVERGSVLGLLGPNGAGKSTLFGCLLGLIRPSAGQITIDGAPIGSGTRRRFGYTPERVALYPQRTVGDNASFFAGLRGCGAADVEQQLARVGMWEFRARKVRQLSKGMLQRVALAIALCGAPDLLILDEPFNGLDPALLDSLRDILLEERDRGATLLISTHTISAIEPLASRIAILLQGRLACSESVQDLRRENPLAGSLEAIYHQVAREQSCGMAEEVAA